MTRPGRVAPTVVRNGDVELSCTVVGDGPLVVMVMGTGSPGRVWHAHQQPALVKAGFRVVTFDNRGIAPSSECADGFSMADMVADTAVVVEHFGGPALVVGTSMGARIAQELALSRPELVRAAAMLGTYGRSTPLLTAYNEGERALIDAGQKLPDAFHAAITAHMNLSPTTLADDRSARDWLDIIGFGGQSQSAGVRAQLALPERDENRLASYGGITRPCLVVGFADDRTLPVFLAREVADAIPGAQYEEIADAGHFGYIEQPAAVNTVLLDFLAAHRD
ncbi:alpha/beta hydrolase [Gordonia humi]|uniref:Pimeloyl-ACP methyl ester carboxylesterase n=1 Tax=Gordonia humi TaxID=686429 RepID=A0A840EVX7_9ACTN|nr:pimeloyl-ACP methyl ester carboxylesterase [Gordonia humi]